MRSSCLICFETQPFVSKPTKTASGATPDNRQESCARNQNHLYDRCENSHTIHAPSIFKRRVTRLLEIDLSADAEDVVFCGRVAVIVLSPTVDVVERPADIRVPVPIQPHGQIVLHSTVSMACAAQVQV